MVYSNCAAVKVNVVHACECLIGLVLAPEPNKPEATTAIGVAIFDDDSLFDVSILGETFLESLVGGVPRQATNEQFRHREWKEGGFEICQKIFKVERGSYNQTPVSWPASNSRGLDWFA